jgi:erythromycin esterase-like protein
LSDARLRDAVRAAAVPLDLVSARPWTPLVERLGGARVVLLGGLGLGAHESTRARAQLTARLIEDHGCHALLVETDACAAVRLDRFVRCAEPSDDASAALAGLTDPAAAPWRCAEVALLLGWLRARNQRRPPSARTALAGLDVLGLHPTAAALLHALEGREPGAAARLRRRLARIEVGVPDPGELAAAPGGPALAGRRRARALAGSPDELGLWLAALGDAADADGATFATALLRDAEAAAALRLRHMIAAVEAWMGRLAPGERLIVWTSDRHAATASPFGHGLGAALRARHGDAVRAVGYCAHHGNVVTGRTTGSATQIRALGPVRRDAWEQRLHDVGVGHLALDTATPGLSGWLGEVHPLRVVGAMASTGPEPTVRTPLAGTFDVMVHLDRVTPVTPLETATPMSQSPSARPPVPARTLARSRA